MAKRKTSLERMAEALQPTPEPHQDYVNAFMKSSHGIDETLKERAYRITTRIGNEVNAENSQKYPTRRDRDYVIDIPDSQMHLYFKPETPADIIEAVKNDAALLDAAANWMKVGGNRYYEHIMEWRMNELGLRENPNVNLGPNVKPFHEWNHWFDWVAWKAEYNRLKG